MSTNKLILFILKNWHHRTWAKSTLYLINIGLYTALKVENRMVHLVCCVLRQVHVGVHPHIYSGSGRIGDESDKKWVNNTY